MIAAGHRTKPISSKRKLILAGAVFAALVVLASAFLVASGAIFTAHSVSPENVFTAGELVLTSGKDDAAILSMDLMRPGDSVTGDITLQNAGNLAGDVQLDMAALADLPGQTTATTAAEAGVMTIEATGADGATVTYSAEAGDDIDGTVPVVFTPAAGSVLPLGKTTVTYSATDASGNVTSASFVVKVVDTTAPVVKGISLVITVSATSAAGAVVNFTGATATDSVGGSVPVTFSPASGSVFPVGANTVTYSAVDAAGNRTTGTFTVIVTPAG